jgi:hypothetical protein
MKVHHRFEYFSRGELSRRVFEAIRNHGDVSAEDLAATAMRDKGLAPMDHVMRRYFVHRFAMGLPAPYEARQASKDRSRGKGCDGR